MTGSFGNLWSFYGFAAMLNAAVGVMFYAINMTPIPVVTTPVIQTHQPLVVTKVAATQGLPTKIIIPSLGLDLPVGVGLYDPTNASWTVDTSKAYYADVSLPINNSNGTTLIYGHAQSSVFESLPTVQPDSEAIVHTDSGYAFHYKMTSMRQVQPNDVTVFTADGPPMLVLQTCIGAYSELRALFSYQLVAINTL